MSQYYNFRTLPSIYSAKGKDELVNVRKGLTNAFLATIQPLIDRINRRGIGLKMSVGPESSGTSNVVFTIAENTNLKIEGSLSGDIIYIYREHMASREEFSRLVPRIVRDLIYMNANVRYEEPSSSNSM